MDFSLRARCTGVTSRPCSCSSWGRGIWKTLSGKDQLVPLWPSKTIICSSRVLLTPDLESTFHRLTSLFTGPGKDGRHWGVGGDFQNETGEGIFRSQGAD